MALIPISRAQAKIIKAALAAETATQEEMTNAAKADAFVQNFINSTPTQVVDYIDANVTDLASAKNVLKKMSLMLLLLARKEYK
jgi:pantothenate synthetase